jgi:hypothetical protein
MRPAVVSVEAQKNGADSMKPIGSKRWNAGMGWDGKSELGQVMNAEPDAHVHVREVDLGHVDGAVAGVSVDNGMQQAMEGAAKLHGFSRCLLVDGPVGAAPGVVAD